MCATQISCWSFSSRFKSELLTDRRVCGRTRWSPWCCVCPACRRPWRWVRSSGCPCCRGRSWSWWWPSTGCRGSAGLQGEEWTSHHDTLASVSFTSADIVAFHDLNCSASVLDMLYFYSPDWNLAQKSEHWSVVVTFSKLCSCFIAVWSFERLLVIYATHCTYFCLFVAICCLCFSYSAPLKVMLLLYLVVFPSYSLIFATYFGSWLQNLPVHALGLIDEVHMKLSDGHVSVFYSLSW